MMKNSRLIVAAVAIVILLSGAYLIRQHNIHEQYIKQNYVTVTINEGGKSHKELMSKAENERISRQARAAMQKFFNEHPEIKHEQGHEPKKLNSPGLARQVCSPLSLSGSLFLLKEGAGVRFFR